MMKSSKWDYQVPERLIPWSRRARKPGPVIDVIGTAELMAEQELPGRLAKMKGGVK